MKKTVKFFMYGLTALIITSICSFAFALINCPVDDWTIDGKTITVSGYGEDVNIFLLNPGKTKEDIKNADKLTSAVNYTNIVNYGEEASYTVTFNIKTDYTPGTYLLYVKSKSGEYSAEVNYVGKQIKRIYVDVNVASGGDGTEENPFSRIEDARDYLRKTEKTAPVEVIVSGGTYYPSQTIEFTSQDSGTDENPITYKVKEGEKFIISGAKKIDTSLHMKKVTDGNILGQLSLNAAKNLVEIDLAASGIPKNIADYLANFRDGDARRGNMAKTTGIYLNGERQNVARWPNSGYKTLKNVNNTNNTLKISDADERMSKWADAKDMFIEGYFTYDWYQQWAEVSDVSESALTLSYSPLHGLTNGGRIAVVNVLSEIDMPGEWYIDVDTMKLYYYTPHRLSESDTLEICVMNKNFITVKENAAFLNFEGFTFEKNADDPAQASTSTVGGNGILIRDSSDIRIEDCVLRHIGMDAIYLLSAERIKIESCTIYDTGLRGIYIKEYDLSPESLESTGIKITNCYISSTTRDSGKSSASGIYIDVNTVGVTIEYNTICNIKTSAIRYSGNLHTIRNNEIYNCMTEFGDAGAIYAGRSFVQYGTVIKNNYFHKNGAGLKNEGVGAVFWDDMHSGNSFVGNIVDVSNINNAAGVRIGGGRDNVIEGNIIVGGTAIHAADRNISFPSEYSETDSSNFYNEQVFQTFKDASNVENAYYITEDDWKSAYKTKFSNIMVNFDELRNQKKYTRIETIRGNIFTGDIEIGEKMRNDSIIEDNITVSDMSIFADAKGGDYRLTDEYYNSISQISEYLVSESYADVIGMTRELHTSKEDLSFNLTFPSDKAILHGKDITLKWRKNYFASAYRYELSDTEDFENIIVSGETNDSCAVITVPEKDKEYFWRVYPLNNSKILDYSIKSDDVYSFTVKSGVYVCGIEFDSSAESIDISITNDTAMDRDICFVVALKDNDGMLIGARCVDFTTIASQKVTADIDASFEKNGDVLELYVLSSIDELKPLSVKYTFEL